MTASRFITFAACISQVLAACSSIEVRKEWRSFTTDEQTAWIDAVKVKYIILTLSATNLYIVHG